MRIVDKPWGREIWWAVTDKYVGKILEVKAGHALSLQYHREKLETLFFYQGEGILVLGEETITVRPMEAYTIEPGTKHRITAITDLTVFEVSTTQLDDVVRLEDLYGRTEG